VAHDLWEPIPKEFDDYISRPKGNNYQSLHTAVIGPGRPHARSADPHRGDAPAGEFGIAAHWRYKEAAKATKSKAPSTTRSRWLRELLAWRDEVADGAGYAGWTEKTKKASLTTPST
jgi:GTP pyrophosphokinase